VRSRAVKREISDIGDESSLLYDLRPVSFRYLEEIDPHGFAQFGPIVEEVAEVAPQLILRADDGTPQMVRYDLLAPLLLDELQIKDAEIDELRAANQSLRTQMDLVLGRLAALELGGTRLTPAWAQGLSCEMGIRIGDCV
jgi:hypothetical protein